jgi:hypothetical protein
VITSLEFNQALQLIADYKLQLEEQLETGLILRAEKINIQQDIKEKTFRALQNYYDCYYNINLEWDDLMNMDRHLLAAIDYDKIVGIRGFGRLSIFNFKKLMIFHSILDKKDL